MIGRRKTARVVAPPANRSTTSDDELEWLQIGMGLGAGVALGFGLFLGLRLMHIRPLAH